MKLGAVALFAVLALPCGFAQAGGSIIWDDFDNDPNTDLGGGVDYSSAVFEDPLSQGGMFALNTDAMLGGDTGALVFSSGSGTVMSASLNYYGTGGTLAWDLAALDATGFEIDFWTVDLDFELAIRISNTAGGGSARGSMIVNAGSEQTVSFAFDDLTTTEGFDLSLVSRVIFEFNPRLDAISSLDFVATEIRLATIPAPSSIAMLGLGGLVVARRRR